MELRERAVDRLVRGGKPEPPSREHTERDDDRFVIRQHQRRKAIPGTDPIAASDASLALDGNAQVLGASTYRRTVRGSISRRSEISRPVINGCVWRSSRSSSSRAVGVSTAVVKHR